MRLGWFAVLLCSCALLSVPATAQDGFSQSLSEPETSPEEMSPDALIALIDEASKLSEAGDYSKASELLRRVRDGMGSRPFYYRGRTWEFEPVYLKILEFVEKRLGPESPDTLSYVDRLATIYLAQKWYEKAEPLYLRAIEARERVLGSEHPHTLFSIDGLALLYLGQGRYSEAELLCLRTLEVRERVLGPEHPSTLHNAVSLATIYGAQGRFAEAEPLVIRAVEDGERVLGPESPITLDFVNSLVVNYLNQGRYGEAEPLALRAVADSGRVLGPEDRITLSSMDALAGLYEAQGRYGEAELLFLRTLDVRERLSGPEDPFTGALVWRLARLYLSQGRFGEAEPLIVRVLEEEERVQGPENRGTLVTIAGLADTYIGLGRYDEAELLYRRILETSERVLGKEDLDTIAYNRYFSIALYKQGRYDEAEPRLLRALQEGVRLYGQAHPDVATIYEMFAGLIIAKNGSQRKATYFYKRTVNALQGVRQNMADLDPSTHRAFLDKHKNAYFSLQGLLIEQGRFAEAEQVGRMFKDLEYLAFVRGSTDKDPGEPVALTRQEREWDAQLAEWLATPNRIAIQLSELRSKQSDEGGLSAEEQAQLADLDAAYATAYEEFFTLVTQWTAETQSFESETIRREAEALELESSRSMQRLLQELGPEVAYLQAMALEDSLHLFFITGEAFVHEEVAVSRSELFAEIFEARDVIDLARFLDLSDDPARAANLQKPLGKLYQLLIAPLEDELEAAGTETLMLNLQGQIRYLPFAALWDGERYLTERLQLAFYTPAANTRYDDPGELSRAQGYGLSNAVEGFDPLPSVPRELEYVIGSRDKPGVMAGEYLLNESFTRTSFEDRLANPAPVVHLATHFKIQPGDEASSYLVLGDGSRVSIAAINRSYKYDFEGVELLTLSACETAIGAESTGMEIEGFGALAQNRGAASVVATLWQVSDDATPEIMRSFYSGMIRDRLSKAGAMQQAQIGMIRSEKYSDPFFWAPFVLMGNWR